MTTFLGIIIFAIPFIFIRFFKDKTVGFLFIFTSSFLMHFIVALATQSVKIFNHSTIIEIYTIIDIFLLFVYWGAWRRGYFPKKHVFGDNIIATESLVKITSESNTKIPAEGNAKHLAKKGWIQKTLVFMAFAIVFLNLISVHYNFSGIINTYVGEYHVDKSAYEYPYFSDEWVAISFVNYAIDSQSLPTVNPLNGDGEFRNPLIPYFSFLADTFLFFGFSPVNDFTLLTFLIGFTICILFFILLNSLGIDKRVSAITLLIVPYITNGGNLPGIWFLIPMVVGLVFYLISLISLAKKDNGLLFVSSIMCLSLYPPFIAFVFPTLLTLFFRKKEWNWKKIFIVLSSIFFAFLLVASITLNNLNPNGI
jgi:hypothetical protein